MDNKELQELRNNFLYGVMEPKTREYGINLISAYEEQAKEIELLKEENEQLCKERDELMLDCQEWDKDFGALEHANIDNLAELEQLRQEQNEAREQLWEAVKALEFIIVKTGNEPFNVQFIVKPLRDAAKKALSHIQGKGITWSHDCPNVDDNYGLQVVESGKECPFCGKSEIGKETIE